MFNYELQERHSRHKALIITQQYSPNYSYNSNVTKTHTTNKLLTLTGFVQLEYNQSLRTFQGQFLIFQGFKITFYSSLTSLRTAGRESICITLRFDEAATLIRGWPQTKLSNKVPSDC